MATRSIEILGGESVYCINETQLKSAFNLAYEHPSSSERIQEEVARLEFDLTRNERAALAFVLIDRLLKSPERSSP